ncbi:MAG: hypothetical protein AAF483_21980 [Planctomycetota bacterium]
MNLRCNNWFLGIRTYGALLALALVGFNGNAASAWQIPLNKIEFDLKKPDTVRMHHRLDPIVVSSPALPPSPSNYQNTYVLALPPGVSAIPPDLSYTPVGWQVRLERSSSTPHADSIAHLRSLAGRVGAVEVKEAEKDITGAIATVDKKSTVLENVVDGKLESSIIRTKELEKFTTEVENLPSSHMLVFTYTGSRPHGVLDVKYSFDSPEPVRIGYRYEFRPGALGNSVELFFTITNRSASPWPSRTLVYLKSGSKLWSARVQHAMPIGANLQFSRKLTIGFEQALELEGTPATKAISKSEWLLASAKQYPDYPPGDVSVMRSDGSSATGKLSIVKKKVNLRFDYNKDSDKQYVELEAKNAKSTNRLLAAAGTWFDVCKVYESANTVKNKMTAVDLTVRYGTASGNVLHVPGSSASGTKQEVTVAAGKDWNESILVSKKTSTRYDARTLEASVIQAMEKTAAGRTEREAAKKIGRLVQQLDDLLDKRKKQAAVLVPSDASDTITYRRSEIFKRDTTDDEKYDKVVLELMELAHELPNHTPAECKLP